MRGMSDLYGWKLKPESAEDVKDAETIQGKRKRLNEGARFDPLIRHIMDSAYYLGLSGEDTMTLLAYEVFLRYEQMRDLNLENAMLSPTMPKLFVAEDKVK